MESPQVLRPSAMRVYRSSPVVRGVLGGIFGLFVGVGLSLAAAGWWSGDPGLQAAGLVLAVLQAVILGPIFWLAAWRYPRLILAPDGLVLRQLGWTLETPWENIDGLVRKGGTGLTLKEPMACRGAERLADFSTSSSGAHTPAEIPWLHERRYMPLRGFGWWLERGDLGTELRVRVPHLAEVSFLPDAAATPEAKRANWSRGLLVGGIIAAALIAGLVFGSSPEFAHGLGYVRGAALVLCGVGAFAAAVGGFRRKRIMPAVIGIVVGLMLVLLGIVSFAR